MRKAMAKRRMVFIMEGRFEIAQARTDLGMNRKVARILAGINDYATVTMMLPDNVRMSPRNLLDLLGEGGDEQRSSMFEYMRLHTSTTEYERNGGDFDELLKTLSAINGQDEGEEEYEIDFDSILPGYC